MRHIMLTYFNRRPLNLNRIKHRGCISFSFDDFPSSAVHTGMKILDDFGIKGTFYTSLGLQDKIEYDKEMFSEKELLSVFKNGHEIGCHTFDHIDCSKSKKTTIQEAMDKNVRGLKERLHEVNISSFAYPKGRARLLAKGLTGSRYVSSRTTKPGINYHGDDANLLKAFSIYSRNFDLDKYRSIINKTIKTGGWLIFYTHDVEDSPSDFGCRPEELIALIKLAIESKALILTVGGVVTKN